VKVGLDHLQLIKFWPSCDPGKGVCGGAKNFAHVYYSQHGIFASMEGCGEAKYFDPPYYSQRAMFASLLSVFFSFSLL